MFVDPIRKIGMRSDSLIFYAEKMEGRMTQIGRTNALIDMIWIGADMTKMNLAVRMKNLDILPTEGYTSSENIAQTMRLEMAAPHLRREHRELRACARLARKHAQALRRLAKKYVYRPVVV